MKMLDVFLNPKISQVAATLLLVPIWMLFGYRHVNAVLLTGEWSYLFLCASETLTVLFLMVRTVPQSVSIVRSDWLIAILGTFSTMLLFPTQWGLLPVAKHAIVLGTGLQLLGIVSLNRSFAIVPARRQIKTAGMYRLVRHPLYASYLITFTGYLLSNSSWDNFAIYLFAMGCLLVRVYREEAHLALDAHYRAYMQRVRFRVIPFVF